MKLYTVNSKKHRSLKAISAVMLFGFVLSSCPQCPTLRPDKNKNKTEERDNKGNSQDPPRIILEKLSNIKLYTADDIDIDNCN
ncbi:hypothetical protein AGMMS49921_01610 [Endomicrobiia bacterium]|nr:hypothetical protein AGMMS49921_01610 [Endomicrobiia bacterium]